MFSLFHFGSRGFQKLVDGKQYILHVYSMYFIHRAQCYDVLSDNPVLLPSECQQGILDS